jgi:ABC-type glycerol-3-phosphate transport system substrate-binding protein
MKNLAIILFIAALIYNCSNNKQYSVDNKSNKSQTGSDKNQETIKWLAQWYGEGKKEFLIHEIAREFEFLNQNIDVQYEFPYQMLNIDPKISWFAGTRDSLIKMIKTNTWPYDLMLCDAYLYQQVGDSVKDKNWGEKYLVDFKNEQWFIKEHKESLFKDNLATSVFGGIAPGAYIEGVWDLFYISSSVEEKLGIKVKEYDMTVDDFIEYAKVVYEYNQKHQDKITFFSMQWDGGINMMFNHLVMSELGKDYKNKSFDPFVVLSNVYQKLEKIMPYRPIEQYTKFANDRELQDDKVLLNFSYTWVTLYWQMNNPEGYKKMRPCELPSMTGKVADYYPGVYQCVFVVPKNAKNKDAAINLMKFITNGDVGFKWEKYSNCPTGLKTSANFSEFGSDAFNNFSEHVHLKYDNKLQQVNLSEILFNSDKNINFQVAQILNGQISANEAINIVKSQL